MCRQREFQQTAFVKPPEGSPDAEAGWVYAYGTLSGRAGTVYLSRVQETQIADTTKYEYWDGKKWVVNKPSAAKPILPAKTTSFFGLFKTHDVPQRERDVGAVQPVPGQVRDALRRFE